MVHSPRILAFALWSVTVGSITGCAPLREASPLRLRNQHAIQLTGYQPLPRAARSRGAGRGTLRLGIDWSNTWIRPSGDGVDLDLETVRGEIDATVGLAPWLDVEIGLPVVHHSGGSLDPLIESFHRETGGGQQARDESPRNEFSARITRAPPLEAIRVFEPAPHGLRVGDIPVTVNYFPFTTDGPFGLGLRAGVEIPSGDERNGTGSGGLDLGAGVVADLDLPGVGVFAWGSYSHVERTGRARRAGFADAELAVVGASIEASVTEVISGITQIQWESAVLDEHRSRHVSKDQVLVWFGVRGRLRPDLSMELALGEDLVKRVSPDVILHFGLTWSW